MHPLRSDPQPHVSKATASRPHHISHEAQASGAVHVPASTSCRSLRSLGKGTAPLTQALLTPRPALPADLAATRLCCSCASVSEHLQAIHQVHPKPAASESSEACLSLQPHVFASKMTAQAEVPEASRKRSRQLELQKILQAVRCAQGRHGTRQAVPVVRRRGSRPGCLLLLAANARCNAPSEPSAPPDLFKPQVQGAGDVNLPKALVAAALHAIPEYACDLQHETVTLSWFDSSGQGCRAVFVHLLLGRLATSRAAKDLLSFAGG